MKDPNWYKAILDAMKDMVLVKGPQSKLLWANKSFRDYYGMSEEELQGIVDGPQSNPDNTLQYVRDDQKVFDTEQDLNIPSEPVTNAQGETYYFHTIKSPLFEDNKMVQSVGVSRQIENTDLLQQDLKELDAKVFTAPLRSIIDTLPISSILLDRNMRIVKSNHRWESFFDQSNNPTNYSFTTVHPELSILKDTVQEAISNEEDKEQVIKLSHLNPIQYFDFKISPWKYPNQQVGGVIIVANNVTSIYKNKQELEISKLRYELMTKGASVGVWDWVDINNDKEFWSPKFYELLGYENQEIESTLTNFANMLHPDDKEKTFALVDQHFKGEANFDLEYRLQTKHGEYRWFRGSGQVSYNDEGKPARMVGSIQDIHERVMAERELKRSNEDLDQFAHIASHDLREPLRGMRNFSEFLLEDYADKLDQDGKGYLNTIKKLGARLEKYLDSLMYYSRLGREEMAYQETDLNTLVEEVIDTCRDTFGQDIEATIEGPLPTIVCDSVKVQKIFWNLCKNAIRYNTNKVKRINISYQQGIDKLHQFNVMDNGIGINEDHWSRIFTLYKRLHGRDQYPGGTGLGLTLVKRAVERHGGEISVLDSIEGQGTTFTFTLKEKI